MCAQSDLYTLWQVCKRAGFRHTGISASDRLIRAALGGRLCSLATAKSIRLRPRAIQRTFDDLDYLHDIGDLGPEIAVYERCGHPPRRPYRIFWGGQEKGAEFLPGLPGGRQRPQRAHRPESLGHLSAAGTKICRPLVKQGWLTVYLGKRTRKKQFIRQRSKRIGHGPLSRKRVVCSKTH